MKRKRNGCPRIAFLKMSLLKYFCYRKISWKRLSDYKVWNVNLGFQWGPLPLLLPGSKMSAGNLDSMPLHFIALPLRIGKKNLFREFLPCFNCAGCATGRPLTKVPQVSFEQWQALSQIRLNSSLCNHCCFLPLREIILSICNRSCW